MCIYVDLEYILVFIVPHVDIEILDNKQLISEIPRIRWIKMCPIDGPMCSTVTRDKMLPSSLQESQLKGY